MSVKRKEPSKENNKDIPTGTTAPKATVIESKLKYALSESEQEDDVDDLLEQLSATDGNDDSGDDVDGESDSGLDSDVYLSDDFATSDEIEFESDSEAEPKADKASAQAPQEHDDSIALEDAKTINDNFRMPKKPKKVRAPAQEKPIIPLLNTEFGIDSSQSDTDSDGDPLHIGNVPREWYDGYDHIGYTLDGKKIRKPMKGDEIDEFLRKMDDPNYWKTVQDPKTHREVILSEADIEMVRNIQAGQFATGSNQCWDYVDFYTHETMIHPLRDRNSKRSFATENFFDVRRIAKLVKAIEKGWITPQSLLPQKKDTSESTDRENLYDLWDNKDEIPKSEWVADLYKPARRKTKPLMAPKIPLPDHVESYNPAEEFIYEYDRKLALIEEEEAKIEAEGKRKIQDYNFDDKEDKINALGHRPVRYNSLRHIPGYGEYVSERFERCLDLYLAPRAVKKETIKDPKLLLPDLPKPEDLEPYPKIASIFYRGHTDLIRSISLDPNGQYLATASDDKTLRVWEVITGKCLSIFTFPAAVTNVAWCPNSEYHFLACTTMANLYFINPRVSSQNSIEVTAKYLDGAFSRNLLLTLEAVKQVSTLDDAVSDVEEGSQSTSNNNSTAAATTEKPEPEDTMQKNRKKDKNTKVKAKNGKAAPCTWISSTDRDVIVQHYSSVFPDEREIEESVYLIEHGSEVIDFSWHTKGNYFSTITSSKAVLIHQLAKAQSQSLFRVAKFKAFKLCFHTLKPVVFIMTQTQVRVYNLQAKKLTKTLTSTSKFLSSMSIHPGSENLIVGSYDRKASWFDMDYSTSPFKVTRFHTQAIRAVDFHPRYPLFASAGDDGKVLIFHGMVYDDLSKNALIVPLKALKGHTITKSIGILNLKFHPAQPWLFSSGADGNVICYM